jgi:SAM-dependent methyltransferase
MSSRLQTGSFHFSHPGLCPICAERVHFVAEGPYFRSTLKCDRCGSVPRHRAIMHVLAKHFPNWRDLNIHQGSPGWDAASQLISRECKSYTNSQYDTSVSFGSVVHNPSTPGKKYRSEDLEAQTFADETFDIVITQDVFEHVFHPDRAIKEIARTLRPHGAVLMSVPLVRGKWPSRRRAVVMDGKTEFLLEPEFHGNPVDTSGSLVTIDWGYDIVTFMQYHSGLSFILMMIDNIDIGVRADLNEVLIGFKVPIPELSY